MRVSFSKSLVTGVGAVVMSAAATLASAPRMRPSIMAAAVSMAALVAFTAVSAAVVFVAQLSEAGMAPGGATRAGASALAGAGVVVPAGAGQAQVGGRAGAGAGGGTRLEQWLVGRPGGRQRANSGRGRNGPVLERPL